MLLLHFWALGRAVAGSEHQKKLLQMLQAALVMHAFGGRELGGTSLLQMGTRGVVQGVLIDVNKLLQAQVVTQPYCLGMMLQLNGLSGLQCGEMKLQLSALSGLRALQKELMTGLGIFLLPD